MGSQDVLPLNLIALLSWGHDKRKAKDLFIGGETRLVSGKAARGRIGWCRICAEKAITYSAQA